MSNVEESSSINYWMSDVHEYVRMKAPEILPILEMYEAEARFGWGYVASDMSGLKVGATVLEVGAGSLLLCCQLVREGFDVTALEPLGRGFSHLDSLRTLVMERASALGCMPQILDQRAEDLSIREHFAYAFSINVMEHVDDIGAVITNVGNSLQPNGFYRFTCPNYLFPYEPHFNIPTVFSKKLTEQIFHKRIFAKRSMWNAEGMWASLNWINVPRVRRIVEHMPEFHAEFNRGFLVTTLERIQTDRNFAMRRSAWVRKIIYILLKFRLHRLAGWIPAMLQPVIDCRLTRSGKFE
jgi:2-polyprenyl-3-methyl-5-hydroxy-6-metoxy-1,4-benzoquinol methylase